MHRRLVLREHLRLEIEQHVRKGDAKRRGELERELEELAGAEAGGNCSEMTKNPEECITRWS